MNRLTKALVEYRRTNPESRAVRAYVHRGGATQRVYCCTFCGRQVDTESAGYPMTQHARRAIAAHAEACAEAQRLAAAFDEGSAKEVAAAADASARLGARRLAGWEKLLILGFLDK